jgi:hypothetical protein
MKGIEEGDNVCFISFTLFVSALLFLALAVHVRSLCFQFGFVQQVCIVHTLDAIGSHSL